MNFKPVIILDTVQLNMYQRTQFSLLGMIKLFREKDPYLRQLGFIFFCLLPGWRYKRGMQLLTGLKKNCIA